MQTVDVELTKLKPYPKNAKKHPAEQVKIVAESIKQFGWAQPIVVDEDYKILIGHGRLKAAELLKLKTAPCLILRGLTDEQKRKLRLIDNKSNESEWDYELLAEELPELDFSDFPEIDWGIEQADEFTDIIEDEAPEVDEESEPTTKLGSDMGRAATGGGLHGKDLTKADVSINVYLHKLVLDSGVNCECSCAIGDGRVWIYTSEGDVIAKRYDEIVEEARKYIKALGGFEKFAEWGLI